MVQIVDKKPEQKGSIPNWRDQNYLRYMLIGPWADSDIKSDRVRAGLLQLANNILQSKQYDLIGKYDNSFSDDIYPYPITSISLDDLVSRYYGCLIHLYHLICQKKGKLLVGAKDNIPLWIDFPIRWFIPTKGYQIEGALPLIITTILQSFGGRFPQQVFDHLLFPPRDNWTNINDWTFGKLLNFGSTIGEHLGFPGGFVAENEFVQIISEAFLKQKYQLIDDYPVLVRLQGHPLIRQIVLVKKGVRLICKIETLSLGEFIHLIWLDKVDQLGVLTAYANFLVPDATRLILNPEETNWALSALIATIYRDLVTCEEKEISTRRTSGKSTVRKIGSPEPKTFTTSWQYIPRRQYVYNRPNDNSYMDREPLSELEKHKQRAIRKWHMVCGHIRRYRDKVDWMASGDKQDQALADGVILRTGETYVRPHARNAGALAELGEIDINSIPHYLRRKTK